VERKLKYDHPDMEFSLSFYGFFFHNHSIFLHKAGFFPEIRAAAEEEVKCGRAGIRRNRNLAKGDGRTICGKPFFGLSNLRYIVVLTRISYLARV